MLINKVHTLLALRWRPVLQLGRTLQTPPSFPVLLRSVLDSGTNMSLIFLLLIRAVIFKYFHFSASARSHFFIYVYAFMQIDSYGRQFSLWTEHRGHRSVRMNCHRSRLLSWRLPCVGRLTLIALPEAVTPETPSINVRVNISVQKTSPYGQLHSHF